MSKYKYIILLVLLAAALLFYTGCPVDTVTPDPPAQTINIPITVEFTASDTETSISGLKPFCLSESQEWNNQKSKIASAKFKEASYWTLSNSPNLKGDFKYSLLDVSNNLLLSVSETNFEVATWIGNPKKLDLSAAQIETVDSRLGQAISSDLCFIAKFDMEKITGEKNSDNEYALEGKVTIILEATLK